MKATEGRQVWVSGYLPKSQPSMYELTTALDYQSNLDLDDDILLSLKGHIRPGPNLPTLTSPTSTQILF